MSIILSGIGNDIHCVALRLIEIELQSRQVALINLGAANGFEFIEHQTRINNGTVLVLSSTNGEFYDWRCDLKLLIESLPLVSILVGGNLLIGDYDDSAVENELRNLGCAEVFSRRGSIVEICDMITTYAGSNRNK